ncbi:hypothetical protein Tcan_15169 [Toxocara canis]|uniref:Uncharacterized protein n=1 Tax=Toxocara canis TaxID=6265 RepID=A0A0B2UWD0_TOXCA|nr:hypothetical protein Tcan_15169 [Toxocara canis]
MVTLITQITNGLFLLIGSQLLMAVSSLFLCTAICAAMLYGLAKQKPAYLLPYIVISSISIACLGVLAVLCVIAFYNVDFAVSILRLPGINIDPHLDRITKSFLVRFVATALFSAYLMAIVIHAWFLHVVFRCFKYMCNAALYK